MKCYTAECSCIDTEVIRHNRTGTTSITRYTGNVAVYKVPDTGCYKCGTREDMIYAYILCNITYLLYTRGKVCVASEVYLDRDLSSMLCSRIAIMHTSLFGTKFAGEIDGHKNIMLTLSDSTEPDTDYGILIEMRDNHSSKNIVQVSLSTKMEEHICELYKVLINFNTNNYPKNLGIFYDKVLKEFPIFSKIVKPAILLEDIMSENIPEIQNKDLEQLLSEDYLTNLCLKSYLLYNRKLSPIIQKSGSLEPSEYMHELFVRTRELFSNKLGELVGNAQYTRNDLYRMLMANILYSTASKYKRVALIGSLTQYISDDTKEFEEYFNFIKENKGIIFYN